MGNFKQSRLHRLEMSRQIEWRKTHISTQEYGAYIVNEKNGKSKKYPHIVPSHIWKETLWEGIRTDLSDYIEKPGMEIHSHDGTNNLLSSWVLCANLYFLAKTDDNFRILLTGFLRDKVSDDIIEITDVELEFAFPEGDTLHPNPLLGETTGSRGTKQTSPDVAYIVKTTNDEGIILVESKYTEHHFYACSTNPTNDKYKKGNLNPDFSRCMKPAKGYDYKPICHQKHAWSRRYMDLITFSENADSILQSCPAATDGYQLFRQQALAEGIAQSGRYDLVASAVAYDGRNHDLIGSMQSTGIKDFTSDWEGLFEGIAKFDTWTHQEWVQYVREHQIDGEFDQWLEYVENRYGY